MSELKVPSYVLNDGSDLPAVGFGTYGLRGSGGVDALVSAVRTGYRLLDSAFNYENEGILGEAVRRCGVCNFLPEHIERVRDEVGVLPSVNQIELHPYFPQADALAYHASVGVRTQSWSPLARKLKAVEDPAITALADEAGVSPARLILRWHYQLGTIPLPKSATPSRQASNLDVFGFSLTEEQMGRISALGRPDGRQAGQDPAHYEEF